ncbi:glycosyltransferase family A protein [uncultured Flavobacterium sp.]|uniref:glycosyltransferase family 2 protein n=1 Tax=uncultured Flavobacterium sp. TaxID=165435 RepID=UPI0025E01CBD|nr:glycosyltransferase family A protein [uncultured Flavobacterium sp.]
MPYFSVVIPLFNKDQYIAETIESVLAQTFTDFEVLIVNDTSTDNSLLVAQSFSDSRIKIIRHPVNKGLSESRNTGIKNSKAEFIAFLDADDLWQPNLLTTIYNLTINHPEAGLYATKYTEIYYGKVAIEPVFEAETGILDNFFLRNINKAIYYPSSLCVRKSVFEDVGYYKNVYLGEDTDINIRANLKYRLAYSSDPLMQYRVHSENQITHNKLAGKTLVDFDLYERLNPDRKDLKKYLDFQRYAWAKRYKMEGSIHEYRRLSSAINPANLNYKQRALLSLPAFALIFIKSLKSKLNKIGLNPTSY